MTGNKLTREQIASFDKNGYLFIPDMFSIETIEKLRGESNRILELLINSSLANDRTSGRLGLTQDEHGKQSVRTVHPYIDLSQFCRRIAVDQLASIVDSLVDYNAVLLDRESQLNFKKPLDNPIPELESKTGTDQFPVHADAPYFEFDDSVVAIIFIDKCTEDNGALEVWPGTHTADITHVESELGLAASPEEVDYDGGNVVAGPAGSLLLMDSRLVHSSSPNATDHPRRLAIFRYIPEQDCDAEVHDGAVRPSTGSEFPIEIIESSYENDYRRQKRDGDFSDQFVVDKET